MKSSSTGRRPGRRRPTHLPVLTLLLLLLAGWLGAPIGAAAQDAGGDDDATVVFLVRHAEKELEGDDPPLTPAGEARARALAHVLNDAGIERIHSTATRRTMSTAEPLGRRLGLEIEPYDGTALEGIARRLEAAPGRHLVVGHSNTTPELVELLGGRPGGPIVEAWEYDRLYMVTLEPDGAVRTVLLRFGEPARP